MNRFEKTHEELKKQLAHLGVFDADCPEEILNSAQNIISLAEAARNQQAVENELKLSPNTTSIATTEIE